MFMHVPLSLRAMLSGTIEGPEPRRNKVCNRRLGKRAEESLKRSRAQGLHRQRDLTAPTLVAVSMDEPVLFNEHSKSSFVDATD